MPCSWAACVEIRRSTMGSLCSSRATTCARAPPSTRCRSLNCCKLPLRRLDLELEVSKVILEAITQVDEASERRKAMPTITTKDGVEIFYKDWGNGQPIVFSHGWPLSADDWDTQLLFFLHHGYRVIAHDRRGHGRSTQTADGHDMDHYADDLAGLTAHLDLKNAIHVGHSTGGGEVAHYLGRHGEIPVAQAALINAVPPLMVKTAANPGG